MNSRTQSKIILLSGLALILVLGGCGKSRNSGGGSSGGGPGATATISNQIATIAAAGDPVTLEELNKWYPEPPAGQNAAPLYDQAFNALTDDDPKSPSFLARNQKAVALLLQAAERKSCRYPVRLTDGSLTQLPHLAKIKRCAALLKAEAVSQAARGHTDAATKASLAGFSLARSLDNEPIVISKLVEFACLAMAFEGLGQALTHKAFTDDQLQSLQSALRDAESLASLRRPLVGERVMVIANFHSPEDQLAKLLTGGGGDASKTADLAAYRKQAKFQEDFALALDYLSAQVALAEMPYAQSLDPAAQEKVPRIETATAQGYHLSALFLPALGGVIARGGEAVARIRIARAVLAIERYRLKHANALPASLAEVVPQMLEAVPVDPFDNHPLRYQKLPTKGYTVYSIGKDRKDDGGATKSADGEPRLDVTMTVGR